MEKPCGIVIDVKELFGSESKSQVYAHIHNLLEKARLDTTSKYIFIPIKIVIRLTMQFFLI